MQQQQQQNVIKDKPNFVMKKSSWTVLKAWHILPLIISVIASAIVFVIFEWNVPSPYIFILLGVLGASLIPVIILIFKIINIKDETISIYDNKVVQRSGILSKHEHTNILTAVLSVTVKQTFWGRICNYGDIKIDVVGYWDIDMKGIKNPSKAREYLERYAANGLGMQQYIMN